MTLAHPQFRLRRTAVVTLFVGVCSAAATLLGGFSTSAQAVPQAVVLSGTLHADNFLVAVDPQDHSRLLLCAETCFSRARSEIGTIVAEGFDGDDRLTLHHNGDLATNATGNLTISFDAGPGVDRMEVCTAPPTQLAPCQDGVATTVTAGASADERVVTQSTDTASVTVTLNDVALVDDRVAGPATIVGTEIADQVTYRATGAAGVGEVAVNVASPYRFAGKTRLTVDSAAGDDRVEVSTGEGLSDVSSCAGAAPVCLRGGSGADTLAVSGKPGTGDSVAVAAPAPGRSAVSGLAGTPTLDLGDIERISLGLQTATDTLSVATTAEADTVRLASTPGGVLIGGDLATSGTAFALPEISVTGDDAAVPLRLSLDTAAGADHLQTTTTSGDDVVLLGPTDTDPLNGVRDTGCTTPSTSCLEARPGAGAGFRLTVDHLEAHEVEAGAGDDRLDAVAALDAATRWRGGLGADRVDVRGTGANLAVALGTGTVTQDGAAAVTSTATEQLAVHAARAGVSTTATDADDDLTFRPDGASSARLLRAGDPMSLELLDVGGSNVIGTGAGNDTMTIEGGETGERWAVGRSADLAVQVGTLLPVRLSGAEAAILRGLGGDDRFDVTGDQGTDRLTVDGGADAGADRLTFAAATTDAEVSVDDDLGTGQLSAGGPPVGYLGVERVDVEGDGGHGLLVRGSDASDTLTQLGNTVTVGRTTDVVFSRFPRLTLDGGRAGDQLRLAPATTTGVQSLSAVGGDDTDRLTAVGTALSEVVDYTVTGSDSGVVTFSGAPPVSFVGTEENAVAGQTAPPSGDLLRISTPGLDGTLALEPGATFDSGTIRFQDLAGSSTSAAPLHFGGLGRGEVEFAGNAAAPADRVVLTGQPDDDVLSLSTRSTPSGPVAVVAMDQRLPVSLPGARELVLDGGDGPDTFRMPSAHPIPGAGGPGIEVRGGGADSGDRLQLSGGGGDVLAALPTATFSETGHAGVRTTDVERVDVAAAGAALRVTGSAGPDALTWAPAAADAGQVTAGTSPVLGLTGLGDLTLDPVEGADQVTVALRSTTDDARIDRGPTTAVGATGLQTVRLPAATVESLTLATGDGADRVRVTGSGGPAALAVDGGAPTTTSDVLLLEAGNVDVSYATDPTSGRLGSTSGAVDFSAVEVIDLLGTGAGSLTVNGTGGAETLTIGEQAAPEIGIDEAAAVTYAGYPTVTLDGHAGDDDITVGYRALGDIATLRVRGGAGAGDRVSVADTPGSTRAVTVRPLTATDGRVTATGIATTVEISEIEGTALNGRGGDDAVRVVTPPGAQEAVVDAGAVADSGAVRVGSLVPLDFAQVGAAGTVTVQDEDGGRVDSVVLRGSAASDTLAVDGGTGRVRLTGWLPLLPDSALDLSVLGGDGDDHATMSGPLPFRTTTFDGGGPDLGDRLAVDGPSGPVEVALGTTSITGYGGVVRFPGVVDLHTDLGGQSLTTVGTSRDDALCYDPMSPRDGRMYVVGAPGGGTAASICLPDQRGTNVLHTFVDVGSLDVDPGAGSDEVIVNGTTSRDLVSVHARAPYTDVAVHPEPESGSTFRLPAHVLVQTTESLVVAADNGADSVDVSAYDSSAPLISVFGEGPSTMRIADSLVLRDATGQAQLRNVNSHYKGAGTVTATYTKGSGAVIRADYDGMESVDLVRDSKVD